jgi:hypothetical protein
LRKLGRFSEKAFHARRNAAVKGPHVKSALSKNVFIWSACVNQLKIHTGIPANIHAVLVCCIGRVNRYKRNFIGLRWTWVQCHRSVSTQM